MKEKQMVTIKNTDGTSFEVELLTYLHSEDNQNTYIVYSKGEIVNEVNDEIVYISKLITNDDNTMSITEIVDDNEWLAVQSLLKKVANV
ncbi:MAG: DUF1292 domain-containing protein [Bacilli bacterium]|nr:DUF1292 domain-containing protein [Bacilli bacterium]